MVGFLKAVKSNYVLQVLQSPTQSIKYARGVDKDEPVEVGEGRILMRM